MLKRRFDGKARAGQGADIDSSQVCVEFGVFTG
jgi:hypothetical protein